MNTLDDYILFRVLSNCTKGQNENKVAPTHFRQVAWAFFKSSTFTDNIQIILTMNLLACYVAAIRLIALKMF